MPNMVMDDLRLVDIRDGECHFEVRSGPDTFYFVRKVGPYRAFIADAARRIDAWIAKQADPVPIKRGAGTH